MLRKAAKLFVILVFAGVVHGNDIELHAFARAPALTRVTLSPDAAHVSYVEQSGERQHVLIRRLSSDSTRRTLSLEPDRERVRWCDWAGPRYLLCATVSPVRRPGLVSERTRLYSIDATAGAVRELNARLDGPIRDDVIDLMPERGDRVLVQHDSAGRGFPEVLELDVEDGSQQRVLRAQPPVKRWMSDGRGEVRLGVAYESGTASLLVRDEQGDMWRTLLSQSLADAQAMAPLAFGARAHDLYVLRHHKGRAALFRLNIESPGEPQLLFADALYDVAGPVLLDPRTRELLGVRYAAEQERTHYFDPAQATLQAAIDRHLPGTVNTVVDRSADGARLLVRAATDVNPPSWYVYTSEGDSLRLLGHEYPALEGHPLATMRPTIYRARDGQRIPAYMTLPPGPRTTDLPAVVLPHGGPEARDTHAFDPLVQFLAAQGYVVLQMNFRGSFGYGAPFAAAGAGEWGGVIHNDITDGARWLVEQGIADPARLCIVGRSFGGYAALLAATREAQWYACAASYAGVSDLLSYSRSVERRPDADMWRSRLGASSRALWEMSPLARVRTVEMPVLLMHGRNDPVVPVSHSRRFARELRQAAKPHRIIERGDCDHDMTIERCRVAFYAALRDFLTTTLDRR